MKTEEMVLLPKKNPQVDPRLAQKLENLVRNTDYEINLVHGQRVYAPVPSSGIQPPVKGTEIFIGNLPPTMYEDELIKIFSKVGPIYMLRLMLDFVGKSRGFGFITYFTVEAAYEAVSLFDKSIVRVHSRIAVSISLDNRRLFMGNIPRLAKKHELLEELGQYVEGIRDIIIFQEPMNKNHNRGFMFVEFETHRLAAIARRQFNPANLVIAEKTIYIDWADPLPIVRPEIIQQIRKLYLSNIPAHLSTDHLRRILKDVLGKEFRNIQKVHKICQFAFVHFGDREPCFVAYLRLRDLVIGGEKILVEWARPIEYSKRYRAAKFEQTYCKSIPANLRRLNRHLRQLNSNPSSGSSLSDATHQQPEPSTSRSTSGSNNGCTDEFIENFREIIKFNETP